MKAVTSSRRSVRRGTRRRPGTRSFHVPRARAGADGSGPASSWRWRVFRQGSNPRPRRGELPPGGPCERRRGEGPGIGDHHVHMDVCALTPPRASAASRRSSPIASRRSGVTTAQTKTLQPAMSSPLRSPAAGKILTALDHAVPDKSCRRAASTGGAGMLYELRTTFSLLNGLPTDPEAIGRADRVLHWLYEYLPTQATMGCDLAPTVERQPVPGTERCSARRHAVPGCLRADRGPTENGNSARSGHHRSPSGWPMPTFRVRGVTRLRRRRAGRRSRPDQEG